MRLKARRRKAPHTPCARGSFYRRSIRRQVDADNQSVDTQGSKTEGTENEVACATGLSAAAGRLHHRAHHDAQKAELCPAQGRARAPHQRHRNHRLYPWHRTQPPRTLGGVGARGTRACPACATTLFAARSTAPASKHSPRRATKIDACRDAPNMAPSVPRKPKRNRTR
jgi:hypothetical protein